MSWLDEAERNRRGRRDYSNEYQERHPPDWKEIEAIVVSVANDMIQEWEKGFGSQKHNGFQVSDVAWGGGERYKSPWAGRIEINWVNMDWRIVMNFSEGVCHIYRAAYEYSQDLGSCALSLDDLRKKIA